MQAQRDPRTKRELVDRLMSYDFGGDFRNLGALGVDVLRKADNKVTLRFKESGQEFELTIRKPAPSRHGVDTRAVAQERQRFIGGPDGQALDPNRTSDLLARRLRGHRARPLQGRWRDLPH